MLVARCEPVDPGASAPDASLAQTEGALAVSIKLPYPAGVKMGITQTWHSLYTSACLGDGHTGSMSYALDFNLAGNNDCGTHATSVAAGTVVFAKSDVSEGCWGCKDATKHNYGWGNVVIVDHGSGVFSKYCHLQYQSVKVKVGDPVCQGQHLGNIGTTGNSTGCHLHWQLQSAGTLNGQSIAFDSFADTSGVPVCGSTYTSQNTEKTTCGGVDPPPPGKCASKVTKAGPNVIDDLCPGFQKSGSASYWWDVAAGYEGHLYYTYTTDDPAPDNGAKWTFDVTDAGSYEVFVYVPGTGATAKKAKYSVKHAGQSSSQKIAQSDYSDQWVSLGTYGFDSGGGQWIEAWDNTGEPYTGTGSTKLGFDAVKLVHVGGGCVPDCVAKQCGGDGCGGSCGTCGPGTECVGNACKCTPDAFLQCDGPDLYHYDACGQKGTLAETCDDGDPCTTDGCNGSACTHAPSPACCQGGASCDDGNPCTSDTCAAGACTHELVNGCCLKTAQCDDMNPCTADLCDNFQCVHASTGACCQTDAECEDGSPCTLDTCVAGSCVSQAVTECCSTDAECADANPCSVQACVDEQCIYTLMDGCCTEDALCNDNQPCTLDRCTAGSCSHTPLPGALVCGGTAVYGSDACGNLGMLVEDCGACGCSDGQCNKPSCDGRVCGDDGCGGSCGACPEGSFCASVGLCAEIPAEGCPDGFAFDGWTCVPVGGAGDDTAAGPGFGAASDAVGGPAVGVPEAPGEQADATGSASGGCAASGTPTSGSALLALFLFMVLGCAARRPT